MLIELTTVPPEALPVARLKEHLRLGSGFADDAVQDGLLAGFLRAALAAIEGRIGRALFLRDFRWPRARPRRGLLLLPLLPLVTVDQVARLGEAGGEQLLEPGDWRLHDMPRPAIRPQGGGGTFRVDFTAGHGAAFDDIPPDLQQAVILLAAHYHDHRHDTALAAGCAPFGVTALLERYRLVRTGDWGAA